MDSSVIFNTEFCDILYLIFWHVRIVIIIYYWQLFLNLILLLLIQVCFELIHGIHTL